MNSHELWQILPQEKQNLLGELHTSLCELEEASTSFDVLTFMVAMGQLPRKIGEAVPLADFELADRLIREEYKELQVGFEKFRCSQSFENMAEMVDGACDLIYVVLWAMLKFNIPFDACFAAVQRSNMAKLQDDGTVLKNEHGKVQKPANWTPPDIHSILLEHFDEAIWKGNMRNG